MVNGGVAGGPWEDDSPASLHPYMCLLRWTCTANYYCTLGSKQVRYYLVLPYKCATPSCSPYLRYRKISRWFKCPSACYCVDR